MMSKIQVYYHQAIAPTEYSVGSYDDVVKSPLSVSGVGFEPVSVFENNNKNLLYQECPAWSHKAKRTFLIKSPIDLDINIDVENQSISVKNITQDQFDKWFILGHNWWEKEKITIQLTIPHFIFWTNQKNIWVESKTHSLTSFKNNFTSVTGWFNLSSWIRPISFAFDVVDPTKPILIKRGDPIYEVSFYSKNLNDSVKLIKKEIDHRTYNKYVKNTNVKKIISNISSSLIFKEEKSKCPFSFLW